MQSSELQRCLRVSPCSQLLRDRAYTPTGPLVQTGHVIYTTRTQNSFTPTPLWAIKYNSLRRQRVGHMRDSRFISTALSPPGGYINDTYPGVSRIVLKNPRGAVPAAGLLFCLKSCQIKGHVSKMARVMALAHLGGLLVMLGGNPVLRAKSQANKYSPSPASREAIAARQHRCFALLLFLQIY